MIHHQAPVSHHQDARSCQLLLRLGMSDATLRQHNAYKKWPKRSTLALMNNDVSASGIVMTNEGKMVPVYMENDVSAHLEPHNLGPGRQDVWEMGGHIRGLPAWFGGMHSIHEKMLTCGNDFTGAESAWTSIIIPLPPSPVECPSRQQRCIL